MAIVKQGSTILNSGAKGDKGEKGDAGSGTNPNSFEATAATLVDGANAGKTASIESVIDLLGATITLQKGMILQFNGGSFTNGTINWNHNPIEANPFAKLFNETNTSHSGVGFPQDIYIEWFGAVADNTNYINSKAGNIITSTQGLTPTDRASSYMITSKGGTLVFSDKTSNYLVNLQDVDDGEDGDGGNGVDKKNYGINYKASDTNIRIDKGVNLKGDDNDLDYSVVLALNNCKNVNVYGGGQIDGSLKTHVRYWVDCVNLSVGEIITLDGLVYTAVSGAKADNTEFSILGGNSAIAIDLSDSINNDTRDGNLANWLATSVNERISIYQILEGKEIIYNCYLSKPPQAGFTITGRIGNEIGILTSGNCENIVIDGLRFEYLCGDGYAISPAFNYAGGELSFESGGLDASGNDVLYADTLRTPLTGITNALYSELGYIMVQAGSYSSYDGEGQYSVYYYDNLNNFISKEEKVWMFEKIPIPFGATQVRCVFFQSKLTYTDNNGDEQPLRFQLRPTAITDGLFIKNNKIRYVARNGISITGGQNIIIENNTIEDTRGEPVLNSGIDIEDGYRINRHIVIRNNRLKNNGLYDIAIQRSHNVLIEGNHFLQAVDQQTGYIRVTTDSADLICTNNVFFGGSVFLSGEIECHSNIYRDSLLEVFGGKIHNETLYNSSIRVQPSTETILKNLTIINEDVKRLIEPFELIKRYSITANNTTVYGVLVYPKLTIEGVTIDGQDILKATEIRTENTYIKNLSVVNSTSVNEIYANEIDGFIGKSLNYKPTTLIGSVNIFKNSKIETLTLIGESGNLLIKDNIIAPTNNSFVQPLVELGSNNIGKLVIKNNTFTPLANDSNSYSIKGSGDIGELIFNNNEFYLPDNIRDIFTFTGVLAGTYIYKNNLITGATLNAEVGGITISNVIDGVETN